MRFLLNMNIPRSLGRRLEPDGHAWRHAADIGLNEATDEEIIAEARRTDEIVVTHDLDYGRLLAFSAAPRPSVVIFRLRNAHPDNLYSRFSATRTTIEVPLSHGALVVLEDAAVRVRRLPLVEVEQG